MALGRYFLNIKRTYTYVGPMSPWEHRDVEVMVWGFRNTDYGAIEFTPPEGYMGMLLVCYDGDKRIPRHEFIEALRRQGREFAHVEAELKKAGHL